MSIPYIPVDGARGQHSIIVKENASSVTYVTGPDARGALKLKGCSRSEFLSSHIQLHVALEDVVEEMLVKATKVDRSILEALEEALDMKTKGKTAEEIRAEIVKLAGTLPAQHPLKKAGASKYPDRAAAIAAYTAVRAVHYAVNQTKENDMSKKVNASETKKTPAPTKKAEAKPAVETKKPEAKKQASLLPEAKPEAAKKAETKPAAGATEVKKTAAPADAAALAEKAKSKAKRAPKGAVNLTGPFKIGPLAEKAKTPEELRMHEGSSRYAMMSFVLSSKKKTFTVEELKAVKGVGDQIKQALSGCVRYEFLAPAQ